MPAPLRHLWWLEPSWPFAGLIGCTIVAAWSQEPAAYGLYRTPKYVQDWHVLLAGAIIFAFVLGSRLAAATGRVSKTAPPNFDPIIRRWFYLTMALTAFGYAVWLAIGIRNGFNLQVLISILVNHTPDADTVRKTLFPTLPGVTTCTQFGVPAMLLGLWLYFRGDRKVLLPLVLLLLVCAFRSHIFNERTALIEMFVPGALMVLRMRIMGRPWPQWMQTGLRAAPFIAPIVLVVFFGSFEYFRSWHYYAPSFNSFPEFVVWRLSGYYTTAHNNGSMALETQSPRPLPYYTLRQIWLFPGLRSTPLSYEKLAGEDAEDRHQRMLLRYGNDELNNEGGLFQPTLDFGIAGSLLFWVGYGFFAGRCYRAYQVGTIAGLTIYPLVFLSILEVPLVLFISYPRMFPAFVTLAAVAWTTRRAAAPAAPAKPAVLELVEAT